MSIEHYEQKVSTLTAWLNEYLDTHWDQDCWAWRKEIQETAERVDRRLIKAKGRLERLQYTERTGIVMHHMLTSNVSSCTDRIRQFKARTDELYAAWKARQPKPKPVEDVEYW